MNNLQPQKEVNRITEFLRVNLGNAPAVIGVSGGIDSAVVLHLLSRSVPQEKIIALYLPERDSDGANRNDIMELSKSTGIPIRTVEINPATNALSEMLHPVDRVSIGNMKSRIRMTVLYYFANANQGIVVGTTNRTELMVGYYTKFGDGACDMEPIMHLLKREVRELAGYLGVPESIIRKKPTAGLWAGQTDEEELGMTYDEMDTAIVNIFDKGQSPRTPVEKKVMDLYRSSEHKRRLPLSLLG
ncbi:MAG: NAD+ synthase [Candidatus Thermoplasmatota archaeon]|nr:NAD+ synthase [Candidatus Thermoplasmatota archaeon]